MVIQVTYSADEFIKIHWGDGIEYAKQYVKDNPKDRYDSDDFAEVYRMNPINRYHGNSHNDDACREDNPMFENCLREIERD